MIDNSNSNSNSNNNNSNSNNNDNTNSNNNSNMKDTTNNDHARREANCQTPLAHMAGVCCGMEGVILCIK